MHDTSILTDLSHHILRSFSLQSSSYLTSSAREFDDLGAKLWNTSTRLLRDDSERPPPPVIPVLRVFAFLLLDVAHQYAQKQGKSAGDNLIRLFRIALKAGKTCINRGQLDLCTRVFERAADYVEAAHGHGNTRVNGWVKSDAEDQEVAAQLVAEYYLLRTTLAWKQGRLDVADHMFAKSLSLDEVADKAGLAEKQTDLLYEIGKEQLKKKRYEEAVRWLERSYDTLSCIELDTISADTAELRLCVMHDLACAHLGIKDAVSLARAADLVSLLDSNYANKMAVSLLRLRLLSVQDPVPAEDFQNVLLRMIRSVILTDSTFKTVMNQVQKLKTFSPGLACQTLDTFLSLRLYESKSQDYIEKTVVTRIWISTTRQDSDQLLRLQELLDEVSDSTDQPFRSDATHAAQTLIWKRIEPATQGVVAEAVTSWCRLACHPLFGRTGELNKSKLSRKLITLSLANGDLAGARQAYFQMPESGRNVAITNYLMYKVALRSGDTPMASNCLEGVLKSSTKDATYLYACVLEAQGSGDRQQTVLALQKVLEKYNYGAPSGINLAALLRCTIRLLVAELESGVANIENVLEEVCKVFEGAANQVKNFREPLKEASNPEDHLAELQWFSKNSYNLALKYCTVLQPSLVVRMLDVCIKFIESFRKSNAGARPQDFTIRSSYCHYLSASASVVLGRSEDNVEICLQYYLSVRRHVESFQAALQEAELVCELDDATKSDLEGKCFELLKYDLEAILKLQRWEELDAVLDSCLAQPASSHWDTLADLVIVIHTHMSNAELASSYQSKIPAVLQKIINQTWRTGHCSIDKLSRWIRCVFQMTLAAAPEVSLQCIEQARSIARKSRVGQLADVYPPDELEWLATTAFNHAVDLYCASDDEACKTWAEKALNLAMEANDGRHLYETLQGKWLLLNVGGQ